MFYNRLPAVLSIIIGRLRGGRVARSFVTLVSAVCETRVINQALQPTDTLAQSTYTLLTDDSYPGCEVDR